MVIKGNHIEIKDDCIIDDNVVIDVRERFILGARSILENILRWREEILLSVMLFSLEDWKYMPPLPQLSEILLPTILFISENSI